MTLTASLTMSYPEDKQWRTVSPFASSSWYPEQGSCLQTWCLQKRLNGFILSYCSCVVLSVVPVLGVWWSHQRSSSVVRIGQRGSDKSWVLLRSIPMTIMVRRPLVFKSVLLVQHICLKLVKDSAVMDSWISSLEGRWLTEPWKRARWPQVSFTVAVKDVCCQGNTCPWAWQYPPLVVTRLWKGFDGDTTPDHL